MVRRLIEEQDVRAAKKSLCQKHANLFLIREIRHLLVVFVRFDAEAVQETFRFRLRIPTVHIGKLRLKLRGLHAVLIRKISLLVKRILLVHDLHKALMPEHDRAQHLHIIESVMILLQDGKALTRCDIDRTLRRLDIAGKHAKEGRLARSVCSDDTIAISRRKLDVHILEENTLAKLQCQSACTNHKMRPSSFSCFQSTR